MAQLSLYVGDLEESVNEEHLLGVFSQIADVVSVKVCRDENDRSLGYAYVNFHNHDDALRALQHCNFTRINGKPIRIMISNRDPTTRKSGKGNVFIKNLDLSIDNQSLHDTFRNFGHILSSKVVTDPANGQSKGYGFVQFETDESALLFIRTLNGMLMNGKLVYVGPFLPHHERIRAKQSSFTNVYVKNLPEDTTDDELKVIFAAHGDITSAIVMRDSTGKSRGFGFVNFQNAVSAAAAVEKLNNTVHGDNKVLYVSRAQRKSERDVELKSKFKQETKSGRPQRANLYVKNLDDDIDDENLKDLFSEYGTITSCKVMLSQSGLSKGFGFVAFSSPNEATKALTELNGKMKGKKRLYVSFAQSKEERKAQLQTRFSQIRAAGGISFSPSGMSAFHPGSSRIAPHQLYCGPGNPVSVPPQPIGYGFQPQLITGMLPGISPNFIIPYKFHRQGQPASRAGRGRNSQPVQPLMLRGTGQGFRYMNNVQNDLESTFILEEVCCPIDDQNRVTPSTIISSVLPSATPKNQCLMLGNQLYPLVERLEPDHVAKVTGMLLEMDQTQVLHLIESPDDLKSKVTEAMEVLHKASWEPELSDQLGALALIK